LKSREGKMKLIGKRKTETKKKKKKKEKQKQKKKRVTVNTLCSDSEF
jgi:hypothetical protein